MGDDLGRLQTALSDRYAIQRELGSGGMATVHLAEDIRHGRHVAVKVLKPELAHALGPERFLREIKITARLTHPHILPLLDSGEADGFLFYVMPFVEGESLRDRLDREKQLPIDDAIQITREVADALSYAHTHDVLHRDIKPENILLESGHAVVADFGIARAISAAGGDRLTETGLAIWTPSYMSPEQAAATRHSFLRRLGCREYGVRRPGASRTRALYCRVRRHRIVATCAGGSAATHEPGGRWRDRQCANSCRRRDRRPGRAVAICGRFTWFSRSLGVAAPSGLVAVPQYPTYRAVDSSACLRGNRSVGLRRSLLRTCGEP